MTAEAEGQCGDSVWWFLSGDTLVLYGSGETWCFGLKQSDIQSWAKEDYENGRAFTTYPEYYEYREAIRRFVVLPGVDFLRDGLAIGLYWLEEVEFGTVSSCWLNFRNIKTLKEVVFPESMASIGSYMFIEGGIEKITILNASAEIGEYFCYECGSLREIWFGGNEKIEQPLLWGMNLSEVTFYVKPGSDAERFAEQKGISYEYY